MSNCEKYLDMISAYADGELSDNEKAELEAHLETCGECRSILETYREISENMALDAEDVPEGFTEGVMAKVASFEKNTTERTKRKNLGVAGRWIGLAACIAIVLVAFPRMPGLGCGASGAPMENAAADCGSAETTAGSGYFEMADTSFSDADGAAPEASFDVSYSESEEITDEADDSAMIPNEPAAGENESAKFESEIGMVITVYSAEIPEELLNSEYEVTYYENGDIEYIIPVSLARELVPLFENAEAEELDADIENMSARIIFTK